MQEVDYADPLKTYHHQNSDNFKTHLRIEDENKVYYAENSKHYPHVDYEVIDNKSIQHMSCMRIFYLVKNT